MLRTFALLLIGLQTAHAATTFDPNAYTVGTNLSTVHPAATVQRYHWPSGSPLGAPLPPTRADVFATQCSAVYGSCLTPTGLGFRVTSNLNTLSSCENGGSLCSADALEFVFSSPTDLVTVDFTIFSSGVTIRAYDISNNFIGECTLSGAAPCATLVPIGSNWKATLTFTSATANIHRVLVGGTDASAFVHTITFN
jgi:hypothetical protein